MKKALLFSINALMPFLPVICCRRMAAAPIVALDPPAIGLYQGVPNGSSSTTSTRGFIHACPRLRRSHTGDVHHPSPLPHLAVGLPESHEFLLDPCSQRPESRPQFTLVPEASRVQGYPEFDVCQIGTRIFSPHFHSLTRGRWSLRSGCVTRAGVPLFSPLPSLEAT